MSEQSPVDADHARVAPTAWGVAYLRTMTDIPLAQEVFEGLEARLQAEGQDSPAWSGDRDHLAPQLEARYKLVDRLLRATGCSQILELAAGVATHGVNMTLEDGELQYVELDLPGVTKHKRAVLEAAGITLPANLTIVDGDALNKDDVVKSTIGFNRAESVAVLNEGLMRYLSFDEKAVLAKNVRAILEGFGGSWVTPDISLRTALAREDEKAKGHIASVSKTTGIDLDKNVFEDEGQAQAFFEELGFRVERHSFLEVTDELVSPRQLNMTDEEVKRLNEPCAAFVMTLKQV